MNNFIRVLTIATFVLTVPSYSQSIKVNKGKAPLIDGYCANREWSDAQRLPLGPGFNLLVKRDFDYLFAAIDSDNPYDSIAYVSLYIAIPNQRIVDLHSSGRLGERVSDDKGNYPDWTTVFPSDRWFNHKGWISNYGWFKCRPGDCSTMKFARSKEFQIDLSKFEGKEWKVYIYYNYKQDGQWKAGEFPVGAKDHEPDNWITLKL